jgi:hypothetical protein
MGMEEFHRGSSRWIVGVPGAHASFHEAVAAVPGNKDACPAQLVRHIERLSDGITPRTSDNFAPEGNGIFAVKARCGLRAYGWFSTYRGQPAFVISHFILKKWQEFREKDRSRVEANRKTYDSTLKETPP